MQSFSHASFSSGASQFFTDEVIQWYLVHKRDLPWRDTQDPYTIWLSEVILQQTRVDQGLPYFYRFLERFPTVEDLAKASEDEVLRLWQGLGYYSRARNMHAAARMVVEDFEGRFPTDYGELLRLKGVGAYTAAAVASFAGGQACAVVDGNVYRVLARFFGISVPINSSAGKKVFQQLADEQLYENDPGLYNQAVMEFGALQCTPHKPDCSQCVLRSACHALGTDSVGEFPVKIKAKPARRRYFHYLFLQDGERVLMHQRGEGDIWANLYQLPLVEIPTSLQPTFRLGGALNEAHGGLLAEEVARYFGAGTRLHLLEGPVKHVLSHQQITAWFWSVEPKSKKVENFPHWNYVDTKDLNNLAKPKLIYSFFDKLQL